MTYTFDDHTSLGLLADGSCADDYSGKAVEEKDGGAHLDVGFGSIIDEFWRKETVFQRYRRQDGK